MLLQIRHDDDVIPKGTVKHGLVKSTSYFNRVSGVVQTDPTGQGLPATAELLH